MFRLAAILAQAQRERLHDPGQIIRTAGEGEVVVAIAVEIDPGAVERMAALGDERHLGAFDGANVPLPLHGFRLPAGVGRVVIANLPDEQRRRVDHRDPERFASGIAGRDPDLDRAVERPGRSGQDCRKPPAGAGLSPHPGQRHPPRLGCRIDTAILPQRSHDNDRLLVAPQPAE